MRCSCFCSFAGSELTGFGWGKSTDVMSVLDSGWPMGRVVAGTSGHELLQSKIGVVR